jgi:hypothetical protein
MIPQALLITLIYSMAIRYFGKDLFMRVEALVKSLTDEDIPGDQKRQIVRDAIKAEFVNIKNITIDTIIQVVLMRIITP